MKPKGVLRHSKLPTTCPYPEPDQSSLHPSLFLKINFNIIIPITFVSPKWSLSLRSQHKNPVCTSLVSLTCHIPRPSLYYWFIIWWRVEILKFLLCNLFHFPVISSLLYQNIILSTLFCNTLSLCSSFSVKDQVSHPYETTGKIIVLYISILMFLNIKLKKKDSVPNSSKHYMTSNCT